MKSAERRGARRGSELCTGCGSLEETAASMRARVLPAAGTLTRGVQERAIGCHQRVWAP